MSPTIYIYIYIELRQKVDPAKGMHFERLSIDELVGNLHYGLLS